DWSSDVCSSDLSSAHDPFELVGRHPSMRGGDDLGHGLWTFDQGRLDVTLQDRLEWLLVFPVGVSRRKLANSVDRKCQLNICWLLGPESAVIVEDGDPFGVRDEIWRVLCRGSFHEGEDRLLDGTVIPGGERGGAAGHDGFRYLGRRSCSAQSGCRPRSTATPFPWASAWLEDGLLHFGVQGRVGVRARNRADPSGGMALGWVRVDCPSYGAKSRCTLVAEGPARAASVGAGAFAR